MADEAIDAGEVTDVPASDAAPTDAPIETEVPAGEAPAEPQAPAFDWQDMRSALTGGDETLEKVVGRYRSADAFAKAFMAQRQKLSERVEAKVPELPDDATPEQIAEYRQAVGIPDDVAEYGVDFAEGFEVGEEDSAALNNFKEFMHERNIPPQQAQAAVEWYQNLVETDRQEKNENADHVQGESSDALKAEWGREFDANQNAIRSYLDQTLGAEQAGALREMRMSDGSYLMDNADVLRLLVQPSVDYMGGDMMIAGDQATMAKTLNERKEELMQLRLTDPVKYKSEAVQEEMSQIYSKLGKIG